MEVTGTGYQLPVAGALISECPAFIGSLHFGPGNRNQGTGNFFEHFSGQLCYRFVLIIGHEINFL